MERGSGVLLHISSLPGDAIGGFGKEAFEFADKLKKAGFKYWQILPLNPTSPKSGNSPYSSVSLFAGNPYFIDLSEFVQRGWLDKEDAKMKKTVFVDYAAVDKHRKRVLAKAVANADAKTKKQVAEWGRANEQIYDFALFSAFAEEHGAHWNKWSDGLRSFDKTAVQKEASRLEEKIDSHLFAQYFFFKQYAALRKYVNGLGIKIIGDFPVYAGFDSADVWANQSLFELQDYAPKLCAGVPPDCFSKTGQLWGNPVYDVEKQRKNGFEWMTKRFAAAAELFDVLRVDHFRGYESFWAVPAGEKTAEKGSWVKGFGKELFDKIAHMGLQIIAEDLGIITDEVNKLKDEAGFPGMNVLQFAYGDWNSKYLPEHHLKNSVTYIGTHDNDTLVGWLEKANGFELENIKRHTGYDGDYKVFFDVLLSSKSDVAVISVQDMFGLDSRFRMNVPSVAQGNWTFKMKKDIFDDELANEFAALNKKYGR